jgi:hypothetical protein
MNALVAGKFSKVLDARPNLNEGIKVLRAGVTDEERVPWDRHCFVVGVDERDLDVQHADVLGDDPERTAEEHRRGRQDADTMSAWWRAATRCQLARRPLASDRMSRSRVSMP